MSNLPKSAKETLQRLIDQIERLEEEKKGLADDIRDKLIEAKSVGFDVKIIKQVLKLRKKSQVERDEEQAILDTYLNALGMLSEAMGDTPMGDWARGEVQKATEARA